MIVFLIQVYSKTSSMKEKLELMAVSMLLLGYFSTLFSMIKIPVMWLALFSAEIVLSNKATNQKLLN